MDKKEIKRLDEVEKNLIKIFKEQQKLEEKNIEIREKSFQPITTAINKVEEKIGDVLYQNKNLMDLVPVVNKFADISIPESDDNDDVFQYNLPASTPFKPIEEQKVVEESTFLDVVSPNTVNTILGPLAQNYLPKIKDDKFGLYWDTHSKQFKIGDKIVSIDNDDLTVNSTKYKGTKGLWRLLSSNIKPEENFYTSNDLKEYTKILWDTNTIYKNNDPSTNKPKASKGDKYKNLIKHIWDSRKSIDGEGIRKYIPNSNIEYRFIDDFSKLYSLMNYIYAQEKAGHNNFLNEKKAIADLLLNKLNETIEKPEGIKYLIRLWPSIQSILDKEGSGIINDLINNLPFELHVPSYNFLGPGTKLDKRLARGDKGINKLDEAAKEHDIFYKNHKDVESRNEADKVLEEKAIERVFSEDADIMERLIAIPTAGTMFIKRKLGMGLDPELKFNNIHFE